MNKVFEIVYPVALPTAAEKQVSPSLPDLNGKVIGELWNWAFRGDETFPMIEEELKALYPDIRFVSYQTFGNFHDPSYEAQMMSALPQKLKDYGVDAVIVGNGCCGTCSPAVARGVVCVEEQGIPAVGVLCKGFPTMAKQVMKSAGYADARVVEYPHPIAMHSHEEVRQNIHEVVVPAIIRALTTPVKASAGARRSKKRLPASRDVVFTGTYDEIQDYFYEQRWSDGLPIVPPTIQRIEEFLKFTSRDPEEVIGIMEPAKAACTVWKVAVNGVMAGCRPEYFPLLLAIADIMCDEDFSVKDSGATPGWEAMIMLNGPIRDQLKFNYKIGHQRPDCMPNVTVGRFYRLMLRNVAGFQIGSTDMSTHGQMFRPVIPENDQVCEEIGFKTVGELMGFAKGENVVTIVSGRVCSDPMQTNGATAEQHLDYITDWATRMIEPYQCMRKYQDNNVLLLSPVVARLLVEAGYTKESISDYIVQHAMVTAEYFELNCSRFNHWQPYNLKEEVSKGNLDERWYNGNDDPKRMVPLFWKEAKVLPIVVGDPTRNRSQFFRSNYSMAKLTARKIVLPENWDELLQERSN